MDEFVQMIIMFVVIILTIVLGGSRQRKARQQRTRTEGEVEGTPDGQEALPPFMENFPFEVGETQPVEQAQEAAVPLVVEQSEPEPPKEPEPKNEEQKPPPVPVDSPTALPAKPLPVTALPDLSPETFRQGIILAEILGRPKTLRSRRR